MTIGRICQRTMDLAEQDETIRCVAQRMGARNVGTLVVLDAKRRPIGILTDRDIAVRVAGAGLDPLQTHVSDVMTRAPRRLPKNTPIMEALGTMRDEGIRRLLVTDAGEALLGIVSLDDILRDLAEEFLAVEEVLEESSPQRLANA